MIPNPTNPESVAAFARRERLVVVATAAPDGAPEAALVDIAADDEGTFFFTAHRSHRKLDNLRANPRAAMVIGTTGTVSLQLEGPAWVAEGAEKAALIDAFRAHYPASRAADPDFEMVAMRPAWVRLYDITERPPTVVEVNW